MFSPPGAALYIPWKDRDEYENEYNLPGKTIDKKHFVMIM